MTVSFFLSSPSRAHDTEKTVMENKIACASKLAVEGFKDTKEVAERISENVLDVAAAIYFPEVAKASQLQYTIRLQTDEVPAFGYLAPGGQAAYTTGRTVSLLIHMFREHVKYFKVSLKEVTRP